MSSPYVILDVNGSFNRPKKAKQTSEKKPVLKVQDDTNPRLHLPAQVEGLEVGVAGWLGGEEGAWQGALPDSW